MGQNNHSVCLSSISSLDTSFLQSDLNVPALIGICVFYILVFIVGIAAQCRKKGPEAHSSHEVMLARRNMNEVVGVFTLTATWVGGDYVCGTAEYLLTPTLGLVWAQVPVFVSLALVFNGLVYAKKMWQAGYVTLLDPFSDKLGRVMVVLIYLVSLFAEVSFAAIGFSVLGSTLSVMVGLSYMWSVVISAVISLLYTVIGGLSSVAYTDIIQLCGVFFGLWLAFPFAYREDAVRPILETARDPTSWLGPPLEGVWIAHYLDNALLLLIGAGPCQMYFQRVFSQKSGEKAMKLSIIAGFMCLLVGVAPVMIGAVAASTDWNATAYREIGEIPLPACDYALALPLVLRFLTPLPVAILGMGAISAAAMSSSDSVILSTSTMFSQNIYKPLRQLYTKLLVSDRELLWVLRVTMVFIGTMTTAIAISVKSIVALINLCVDLPYCIVFPQLICVLYHRQTNAYGAILGYTVALVLRLTGGESFLGLKPIIYYPWYDPDTGTQRFPFKTLTVLIHFLIILSVSWLAEYLASHTVWFRKIDRLLFAQFLEEREIVIKEDKKAQPKMCIRKESCC